MVEANKLEAQVTIRLLEDGDRDRGFFDVLSQLTDAPKLSQDEFTAILKRQRTLGIRRTLVAVDEPSDSVIATGSAMIEHKFIRGGRPCGHIEDVVVDKNERGRRVGLRIISELVDHCESEGCYKVVLDCSSHNIEFYEKCGLQQMGKQMGKYFDINNWSEVSAWDFQ